MLSPLLLLLASSCSSGGLGDGSSGEESAIKDDETVVFFPSTGRLAEDPPSWMVTIRGWVFEPEKDSKVRSGLLALFRQALGLSGSEAELASFKERGSAFLVDNERGKAITIRIGQKVYPVGKSEPNGHFSGTLRLPEAEVRALIRKEGSIGRLPFELALGKDAKRSVTGEAYLLDETGLSVISDIDDTIKVSEVKDRKALLANTFLREYRAVPGMAELYAGWARKGAAFHYVTASPWQLYEPLSAFVQKSGFPAGTFDMKLFRWKDSTFFDLFASPEEYKPTVLTPLLEGFPKRRFILVGDSGEKDPEIYGALQRKFPDRIEQIFIRDTTGEGAASDRMKKAFGGVPVDRWKVFRDPKDLLDVK